MEKKKDEAVSKVKTDFEERENDLKKKIHQKYTNSHNEELI
jgi:hypothetical protein